MNHTIDFYDLQTKKQTEPALLIGMGAPSSGSSNPCVILTVEVVEIHADSRTIRNYSEGWRDEKGFAGLGFRIYLFADAEDRKGPHHFRVEYTNHGGLELAQVEKMAKTLRRIQNKTEKQQQELGFADSTGENVRRFAAAIGAKHVIFDEGLPSQGFGYDENRANYTWRTTGDGKNEVNHMIHAYYYKLNEKAEEAAA